MFRISSHEAILASTACRDRWLVGALSSAGHSNIALFAPKPPPSLGGALSCRKSTAFQTRALFRSHGPTFRSEEHTSELQSLMRNSYAAFGLKKQITSQQYHYYANF